MVLFSVFFSTNSLSQKGQPVSIEITNQKIEKSLDLRDQIRGIEILNVSDSRIQKGSYITFLMIEDEVYIATLGGKTVLKLGSDGKVEREILSEKSSTVNFISAIWNVDDHIFIYDATQTSVFEFDVSGRLLKSLSLNVTNAIGLAGTKDFIWADMNRMKIFGSNKPTKHNLLLFDREMNFDSFKVPHEFNLPFNTGTGISSFSHHNGSLYYQQPHSKTIYHLSKGNAIPIAELDFDRFWPFGVYDSLGAITHQELNEIMSSSDRISYLKSYVSDNQIFLEFKIGKTINYALVDRLSGKVKVFSLPVAYGTVSVINWFDDCLGIVINKLETKDQMIQNSDQIKISEKPTGHRAGEWSHSILFIDFNSLD